MVTDVNYRGVIDVTPEVSPEPPRGRSRWASAQSRIARTKGRIGVLRIRARRTRAGITITTDLGLERVELTDEGQGPVARAM